MDDITSESLHHPGQSSRVIFLFIFCCPVCIHRSASTAKAAPLNINKVSSSLLSFGRKLIAPAMSGVPSSVAPINSEVYSSSSSSSYSSSSSFTPPASAPALSHPLAEPSAPPLPQTQVRGQTQNYRLLKSESMPVHLGKGEDQETAGRWQS